MRRSALKCTRARLLAFFLLAPLSLGKLWGCAPQLRVTRPLQDSILSLPAERYLSINFTYTVHFGPCPLVPDDLAPSAEEGWLVVVSEQHAVGPGFTRVPFGGPIFLVLREPGSYSFEFTLLRPLTAAAITPRHGVLSTPEESTARNDGPIVALEIAAKTSLAFDVVGEDAPSVDPAIASAFDAGIKGYDLYRRPRSHGDVSPAAGSDAGAPSLLPPSWRALMKPLPVLLIGSLSSTFDGTKQFIVQYEAMVDRSLLSFWHMDMFSGPEKGMASIAAHMLRNASVPIIFHNVMLQRDAFAGERDFLEAGAAMARLSSWCQLSQRMQESVEQVSRVMAAFPVLWRINQESAEEYLWQTPRLAWPATVRLNDLVGRVDLPCWQERSAGGVATMRRALEAATATAVEEAVAEGKTVPASATLPAYSLEGSTEEQLEADEMASGMRPRIVVPALVGVTDAASMQRPVPDQRSLRSACLAADRGFGAASVVASAAPHREPKCVYSAADWSRDSAAALTAMRKAAAAGAGAVSGIASAAASNGSNAIQAVCSGDACRVQVDAAALAAAQALLQSLDGKHDIAARAAEIERLTAAAAAAAADSVSSTASKLGGISASTPLSGPHPFDTWLQQPAELEISPSHFVAQLDDVRAHAAAVHVVSGLNSRRVEVLPRKQLGLAPPWAACARLWLGPDGESAVAVDALPLAAEGADERLASGATADEPRSYPAPLQKPGLVLPTSPRRLDGLSAAPMIDTVAEASARLVSTALTAGAMSSSNSSALSQWLPTEPLLPLLLDPSWTRDAAAAAILRRNWALREQPGSRGLPHEIAQQAIMSAEGTSRQQSSHVDSSPAAAAVAPAATSGSLAATVRRIAPLLPDAPPLVVAFIGRIAREKGVGLFLKSVRSLVDSHRCVLVDGAAAGGARVRRASPATATASAHGKCSGANCSALDVDQPCILLPEDGGNGLEILIPPRLVPRTKWDTDKTGVDASDDGVAGSAGAAPSSSSAGGSGSSRGNSANHNEDGHDADHDDDDAVDTASEDDADPFMAFRALMSAPRARLYGHRALSDEGLRAEMMRSSRLLQYLQPSRPDGTPEEPLPGLAPRGTWQRRQLRLFMIGGTAHSGYLASMRALAVRLGVDRLLDWVGFVHPTQLMRWYKHRCMDVVVAPYLRPLSESFGLVLTEAMEAGLPVLHFAVGGIQDYARPRVVGNTDGERQRSAVENRVVRKSLPEALAPAPSGSSSGSASYPYNSFIPAERSGVSLARALLGVAADARTRRRVAHEASRFVRSTLQRDNVAPPLEVVLRHEAVAARLLMAHLPGGYRELAFAGVTCPTSHAGQQHSGQRQMQPALTWAEMLQVSPASFGDMVSCRPLQVPLAGEAAVEPTLRGFLSGSLAPAAGGAGFALSFRLRATVTLRRPPTAAAAAESAQAKIDAMLADFAAKVGMTSLPSEAGGGRRGNSTLLSLDVEGSGRSDGMNAESGLHLSEALAPGFPDVLCGLAPSAKHVPFYRLDGADDTSRQHHGDDDGVNGSSSSSGSAQAPSLCSIETVRKRAGALVRDRLLRTARLCWAVDLLRAGAPASAGQSSYSWATDLAAGATGAAGGCSYLMDIGPGAVTVSTDQRSKTAADDPTSTPMTGQPSRQQAGLPVELAAVDLDVRFQLPLSQRETSALSANPAAAVLFALTDNRLPHPVLAASACTLGRSA